VRVRLTPYEVSFAAQVGLRRQLDKLGEPDAHGFEGDPWGVHIEGACGEMAVAKAMNVYWSGSFGTFKKGGDVARLEVRRRSKPEYELIVRTNDRNQDLFVLVFGKAPEFLIRGWMRGADAKRSNWLKAHGGRPSAYFVPHDKLKPADQLEKWLHGVLL